MISKKTPKRLALLSLPLTLIGGAFLNSRETLAWGPERPTYTMENPATSATFNSITNNAAVGDERDFVRIVEMGTNGTYEDSVEIKPGKKYQVYIYYHNDASATFNDAAHNYAGVARETRLSSSFTTDIKAGEKGIVTATISSTTASPEKVWDEAFLVATEDVHLAYEAASAKIYNDWDASGSVLSTNLFSNKGTFIGLDSLDGLILGCDEFSGQVIYNLVATGNDQPTPTPTPVEPDNPDSPEIPIVPETPTGETPTTPENTPTEIPTTGPAEIALASTIAVVVFLSIFFFWKSRRDVQATMLRAVRKHNRKEYKRKR